MAQDIKKRINKLLKDKGLPILGEEKEKVIEKIIDTDRLLMKMDSFLNRKDIIDLENSKIDAIRLFVLYLEDKNFKSKDLVKFLKS